MLQDLEARLKRKKRGHGKEESKKRSQGKKSYGSGTEGGRKLI